MLYKRCKIIVAESEPEIIEAVLDPNSPPVQSGVYGVDIGFLWFKPSESKFYEVIDTSPFSWRPVALSGDFSNVNFIGDIAVSGDLGITGSKTVGGFKITFKKGILTGFEAV